MLAALGNSLRLSENAGPDMTIDALMSVVAYFRITRAHAREMPSALDVLLSLCSALSELVL